MIKVEYTGGTYMIDEGVLIANEPRLNQLFKKMDKVVQVWEGEPDYVLARRLKFIMGEGTILVKLAEQSDPEIIY